MLKVLVAVLLSVFVATGHAAVQAKDNMGTTVTLMDTPCVSQNALEALPELNGILATIGHPGLKAADLTAASVLFKGKIFAACWALVNTSVVIIDDGRQPDSIFVVPASDFREVPGI